MQAHSICRSQEVGERIPVRWVEDAVAQEIVKGSTWMGRWRKSQVNGCCWRAIGG